MTTFSTRHVARLHQQQFGPWCDPTGKPDGYPPPRHPYTCPNRGDHPVIAGDKGILVPTIRGWICQCCDYTQPQPDEALAAASPAPDRDARQATVAECVVRDVWAEAKLAHIGEATLDDLHAFAGNPKINAARLRLGETRPDLVERIDAALAMRFEALRPSADEEATT